MDHIPPIIEIIPKIRGFWCRVAMFSLYGVLTYTPIIVGIWLGIAFFLFLTLVSGVVSSKMRICSIPFEQREMSYSTMAIVKWYLARNICLKN